MTTQESLFDAPPTRPFTNTIGPFLGKPVMQREDEFSRQAAATTWEVA